MLFMLDYLQQYADRGSMPPPVVIHPALKDVLVVPSRGPNQRDTDVSHSYR